jgi:phospholipase C
MRSLWRCLAAAALLSQSLSPAFGSPNEGGHSKFGHVFIIVLENEGFDVTFGPNSKAPYLSKTLTSQGVLLSRYYGTGHASLDNYIAMISGQAATPETRDDCQTYHDFNLTGITGDGQAVGSGCVYPASIKTLPHQLDAAGKTWRAYMGDMGNDPSRESATCGHPTLNAIDHTQSAEAPSAAVPLGDQYASRHNPFVYFHSIIDSSDGDENVVNLNQLATDLKNEHTTPNFVFITPNLCDDGHDGPCVNGQPGGLVSADAFLQKWVPLIMASDAYKKDGLLIINFDEGEAENTAQSCRRIRHQFSRPLLLQRTAWSQPGYLPEQLHDRNVHTFLRQLWRRSHRCRSPVSAAQARLRLRNSVQSLFSAAHH